MRVTNGMIAKNVMTNINQSYGRLDKLFTQVQTQKKISRPSDDPVVAMKGMFYRMNVLEVEQFKRNFTEAHNWVETTDSAIGEASKVLERIRELTVQASNETYDGGQLDAIKEEVAQLKSHIKSIANSKVGDKYIFNGTDTLTPPVDSNGNVSFNSKNVEFELAKGIFVPVNMLGENVFGSENQGNSIFSMLDDLENALGQGDTQVIGGFLDKIDASADKMLSARSELGARTNRLEFMEERIDNQEIIAKRIMSDNEDIDFEKVVMEFKQQEAVHTAAMSVGARIIQPTLMDFLR
ncbi:flagellar hook-associated protein FlgL [Lederbergia wuyishanensis]|uniref:Flagellar hook-associated protein 3 FlgL n=1 Tax=Lederbergia wuyishanensis TaxID=1347903 RepID=A0ABU0D8T1_9BACI|nr:flagellar hook-associated protein FlgL [Lederbergia wuyishanensis]MCJ8007594.1 flagellar hook-associated protein FlgL [Lederbergia wuyishanensis]MDQ0344823.1 flagellar hook-associated protein 3 FlgL [Lederbergia wuyishanensis]